MISFWIATSMLMGIIKNHWCPTSIRHITLYKVPLLVTSQFLLLFSIKALKTKKVVSIILQIFYLPTSASLSAKALASPTWENGGPAVRIFFYYPLLNLKTKTNLAPLQRRDPKGVLSCFSEEVTPDPINSQVLSESCSIIYILPLIPLFSPSPLTFSFQPTNMLNLS